MTQSSRWKSRGEQDPHGTTYDCERSQLPLGHLTDDELANGAFLHYDIRPPLEEILAGTAHSPIAWMTAVKERIRWLSRSLEKEIEKNRQRQASDFSEESALPAGELVLTEDVKRKLKEAVETLRSLDE